MSSSSQTPEFYVGQMVIGKPDDEKLGINGMDLQFRAAPLRVMESWVDKYENVSYLTLKNQKGGRRNSYSTRVNPFIITSLEDYL